MRGRHTDYLRIGQLRRSLKRASRDTKTKGVSTRAETTEMLHAHLYPLVAERRNCLSHAAAQAAVSFLRSASNSSFGTALKLKHVLPCIRFFSAGEISFSSVGDM